MPKSPQVMELLHRWEELRASGADPTPEELCAQHPESLEAVRDGIARLRAGSPRTETGAVTVAAGSERAPKAAAETGGRRNPIGWVALALGAVLLLASGYFISKMTSKDTPKDEAKSEAADNSSKKDGPTATGPQATDDPERFAVELLHPHSPGLWVRMADGREVQIKKAQRIPNGRFVLTQATWPPQAKEPAPDFFSTVVLPAVLPLTSLENLTLNMVGPGPKPMTEEEVAALASAPFAPKLQKLTSVPLTPKTLDSLKKFPNLVDLSCWADRADDADLARLKELPNLKKLLIFYLGKSGRITQKGYAELAGLPLTRLGLGHWANLNVEAIRLFADMPELTLLGLRGTGATDALLPELTKFSRLKSITLADNEGITDAGIMQLAAITTLQEVAVGNTKVTKAGAEKLSEALPKCQILLGTLGKVGPKEKPPMPEASPGKGAAPPAKGAPPIKQANVKKNVGKKIDENSDNAK